MVLSSGILLPISGSRKFMKVRWSFVMYLACMFDGLYCCCGMVVLCMSVVSYGGRFPLVWFLCVVFCWWGGIFFSFGWFVFVGGCLAFCFLVVFVLCVDVVGSCCCFLSCCTICCCLGDFRGCLELVPENHR